MAKKKPNPAAKPAEPTNEEKIEALRKGWREHEESIRYFDESMAGFRDTANENNEKICSYLTDRHEHNKAAHGKIRSRIAYLEERLAFLEERLNKRIDQLEPAAGRDASDTPEEVLVGGLVDVFQRAGFKVESIERIEVGSGDAPRTFPYPVTGAVGLDKPLDPSLLPGRKPINEEAASKPVPLSKAEFDKLKASPRLADGDGYLVPRLMATIEMFNLGESELLVEIDRLCAAHDLVKKLRGKGEPA